MASSPFGQRILRHPMRAQVSAELAAEPTRPAQRPVVQVAPGTGRRHREWEARLARAGIPATRAVVAQGVLVGRLSQQELAVHRALAGQLSRQELAVHRALAGRLSQQELAVHRALAALGGTAGTGGTGGGSTWKCTGKPNFLTSSPVWQYAGPPYQGSAYTWGDAKGPTVSSPGPDQFMFNGTSLPSEAIWYCVDYEILSYSGSGDVGRTFWIVMPKPDQTPWDRKTPDNFTYVPVGPHVECVAGPPDTFVRSHRDYQAALLIWDEGVTLKLNRAEACLQ